MKKPVYKVLDEKGRVLIPLEMRQKAEMEKGDILKVSINSGKIVISKEASTAREKAYQDYVMQHEMAVAKQQSEAWRKALDGVPDSLRMLLEINNTENVPEYSEKQKKQYNDAIKAYDHTGNGVSWSQFEWKTYDTQMTVTFEDSVKVEGISKGMNLING